METPFDQDPANGILILKLSRFQAEAPGSCMLAYLFERKTPVVSWPQTPVVSHLKHR